MASAILFESRTTILAIQSSVTGSAFRGFILVLQNNSMLQDTQMSRSNMGAFLCIHSRNPSSSSWLNEVKDVFFVYCALIGLSHSRCDRIGLIIERGLIHFNPIFIGPEHSGDMLHITIGPCTGQSAGSARANRIV